MNNEKSFTQNILLKMSKFMYCCKQSVAAPCDVCRDPVGLGGLLVSLPAREGGVL